MSKIKKTLFTDELISVEDQLRTFKRNLRSGHLKQTDLVDSYEANRRLAEWVNKHPMPTEDFPKIDRIPIKYLKIAPMTLQRDAVRPHIVQIADNFNPRKFGTLTVVKINGDYLVLDGQQRVCAARLRFDENKEVPCVVLEVSVEEAADIFLDINIRRRSVNQAVKHRVRVTRGDADAVTLDHFLENQELYLIENERSADPHLGKNPSNFTGVTGPTYIYDMWNLAQNNAYPEMDLVLTIYRQVFTTLINDRFRGGYIYGIFLFLYTWQDMLKLTRQERDAGKSSHEWSVVKGLKLISTGGVKGGDAFEANLCATGGQTPAVIAKDIARQWHSVFQAKIKTPLVADTPGYHRRTLTNKTKEFITAEIKAGRSAPNQFRL